MCREPTSEPATWGRVSQAEGHSVCWRTPQGPGGAGRGMGRESMRRTEWEAGRSGHSTFLV